MFIDYISRPNGEPLVLDNLVNFLGYQIQHKVTGRLLPHTNNFIVYTANAAMNKLCEVGQFYEGYEGINIMEYEFIPLYDFEFESGWLRVTDEKDWEQ